MDFFDKQARAQRRTKWLVVYFLLAVIGIIATLHVIFALILGLPFSDYQLLGSVALGVCAAVALGSVVKTLELAKGGRAVAAMLGGTAVDFHTTDPAQRRLINVVEEMSLASGVPVPELYILEEPGINAFAAGHGPGDTAIGVTRGCVENLTRDELQGVIGHEYSHILHGDMKLNLRLIGILNGILFLAIIGGFMMRVMFYSPRSSRSSKDGGGLVFAIMAGGIALYLVGWIGVFFGKLIKAAVSREREFLADASSVQYTRNPDGLAGALTKIGQLSSRLQAPRAEEASHLFFGNGLAESWLSAFSTHPPIADRIREIAPGYEASELKGPRAEPTQATAVPASGMKNVLLPGQPQLNAAVAMLGSLPEFSQTAAHELHGAVALVYALLLSNNDAVRATQLANFAEDEGLNREVLSLYGRRKELSSAQKLALVDLAIPTLRHMSHPQYESFRSKVQTLIEADGEIQLFEYTLQKLLFRHMELYFTDATGTPVRYKSIVPLLPEVGTLLSALASSDEGDSPARDAAFSAGVIELLVKPASFPLVRSNVIDLKVFDAALDRLAEAAPDVKRTILTACGAVAMHDGIVNDQQIELLRAVADVLGCPIPPFVKAE